MTSGNSIEPAADHLSDRRAGEHAQTDQHRGEFNAEMHAEKSDSLVGETDERVQGQGIRRRQTEQSHEIPEQELQEQGNLTDQTHIRRRELTEEWIDAAPRCSSENPEDGRGDQAGHNHLEAVEPSHEQGPGIGIRRLEGNRVFSQGKSRRPAEPAEADAQAGTDEIHREVVDQHPCGRHQHKHKGQLHQQPFGGSLHGCITEHLELQTH